MGKKTKRRRGSGSVFKHGNNWYIGFYFKGRQIKEKVGPIDHISKGQAENALKARMGEIVQGKFDLKREVKSTYFYDLMDRYIKYAELNFRAPKRVIQACNQFRKFFPNKNLIDITTISIEDYKHKRQSEEVGHSSINRELAVMKAMFNMAIDWELLHSANPVYKVKYFKLPKSPTRVLNEQEFLMLCDCAADHLKPILKCAYFTGMRKSEVLNLKWDDVNIFRGSLIVRETKNYEYRERPINDQLKKLFISLDRESEYVFSYEGKRIREFKTAFKTALVKSQIPYCRFHDIRHTFATNLVANGVDIVTVQDLLGHKDIQMTRRYSHPTPENKRIAVNILIKSNEIF